MFHSQIAAPSARSSRHHRSLRPPPKRTPARFYVVSSGRAGLACAAVAKSCSCSFYSPHKSNMLKRETKCVSIWLREEAGGSWLGAAKCRSPAAAPRSGRAGVRCGGPAAPHGPAGLGSARLLLRAAPRERRWAAGQRPLETGDTFRARAGGHFSTGCCCVAGQGSADGNTSSFI